MAGKGGKVRTSWKPGQSGNPAGRPKNPLDIEYLAAARRACSPEDLERTLHRLREIAEDRTVKASDAIAAINKLWEFFFGKKGLHELQQMEAKMSGIPPTDPKAVLLHLLATSSDPRVLLAASQSLLGLDSGGAALERFLGAMAAAPDPWASHKPALGAEDWRPEGEE